MTRKVHKRHRTALISDVLQPRSPSSAAGQGLTRLRRPAGRRPVAVGCVPEGEPLGVGEVVDRTRRIERRAESEWAIGDHLHVHGVPFPHVCRERHDRRLVRGATELGEAGERRAAIECDGS